MIMRVLRASSPEVEDLILGIKMGWNKDPSIKGRVQMLAEELSWTWEHHKGAIAGKSAALILAGSLVHSHFHTASAHDDATAALDAASRSQEVVVTTGGVVRSGPVLNGHAQIKKSDYPEANAVLKNSATAACQTVKLDVKEGAWKLPLTQHFGTSSVTATQFSDTRFDNDKYVCVADAAPTPSRT